MFFVQIGVLAEYARLDWNGWRVWEKIGNHMMIIQ